MAPDLERTKGKTSEDIVGGAYGEVGSNSPMLLSTWMEEAHSRQKYRRRTRCSAGVKQPGEEEHPEEISDS